MGETLGAQLVSVARRLWSVGNPAWKEVIRLANRIVPGLKKRLRGSARVRDRAYSVLGLRLSEHCRLSLGKIRSFLGQMRAPWRRPGAESPRAK